jgi:hypothetical protein
MFGIVCPQASGPNKNTSKMEIRRAQVVDVAMFFVKLVPLGYLLQIPRYLSLVLPSQG